MDVSKVGIFDEYTPSISFDAYRGFRDAGKSTIATAIDKLLWDPDDLIVADTAIYISIAALFKSKSPWT